MCNCSTKGCSGNCSIQLPIGPQGIPGMSAYEIWIAQGNTGSEQNFIDSLKGPQGIQGVPGDVTTSDGLLHKFTTFYYLLITRGAEEETNGLTRSITAEELAEQGVTASAVDCVITIYYKELVTQPWNWVGPNFATQAYSEQTDVIKSVTVNSSGISMIFNREGYYQIVVIG